MIKKLCNEWDNILSLENASPYLFRTRLERTVNHILKYATITNNSCLIELCNVIMYKLQYISDQSNQTSDGCLKSFQVLKQDMLTVKTQLNSLIIR